MTARKNIIPVFIPHLGCPHDCVFCNQKRISGSLLPACPEDVVRAIEKGLEYCSQPPQLAFYGGSFTAIEKEQQIALLSAAKPYIESGRIHSIRLSTRPDAISPEILQMLRQYGVDTIELGAQSMINSVLLKSGRGHLAEDTEKASALIKAAGFKLILQMMTGLPGSDDAKDIESARRIIALCPDGVRIYPTVIIKDTALFDLWQQESYTEHCVEDAVRVCSVILPMFEAAAIPVIRLGLNPTDELSGGDALGGAYHPALGELVKSRIMLNKARELLSGGTWGKNIVLAVSASQVSQMSGQHRCNIKALKEEFGFENVRIKAAELSQRDILIQEA